ncbi:MAG: 50S ribosomal protein L7 [Oscillospiraceae bacterium]
MNKIMSLLTVCRRAGKLALGADLVKDALKTGTAWGVFAASDLSEKSLKELRFHCARYSRPLFPLGMTMDEVSEQLGKRTGALAVCDAGFFKKAKAIIEETTRGNAGNGAE